jgi:hypothetical protein
MQLPTRKTKVEVILYGSVPAHWDKARCKAKVEKLNDELEVLAHKAERYQEANGYACVSIEDQACQIMDWIMNLEEAMKTR